MCTFLLSNVYLLPITLILMGKIALLSSELNHCLTCWPLDHYPVFLSFSLGWFWFMWERYGCSERDISNAPLWFLSLKYPLKDLLSYAMVSSSLTALMKELERCLEVREHMNNITITHKSASSKPSVAIIVMHRPCFITVPHDFSITKAGLTGL